MIFQLEDFDFENKRVLARFDFNVAIKDGRIVDETRLNAALPTIRYILEKNPRLLILSSHLGRPKGEFVPELMLDPVAQRLSEMLGIKIEKTTHTEEMDKGVYMIENVQFHPGERKNSLVYAKELADLADLFVLDAFGQSHREYASICGVQRYIPGCAGLLLKKELENLEKARDPEHPFCVIIGGAKFDKIEAIEAMGEKADHILLGGIIANTFLRARGHNIGASKFDPDGVEKATELFDKIVVPVDCVVAKDFDSKGEVADVDDVPCDSMILDVGPKTIELYKQKLKQAKTIMWGGPIGVFEKPEFANGTKQIAEFLAGLDSIRIIGGGESAASVKKFGVSDKMTHVSTGGGASLQYVCGNKLPGVAALEESYRKFKS